MATPQQQPAQPSKRRLKKKVEKRQPSPRLRWGKQDVRGYLSLLLSALVAVLACSAIPATSATVLLDKLLPVLAVVLAYYFVKQ